MWNPITDFLRGVRRVRESERKADTEFDALRRLSEDEAQRRSTDLLSRALTEVWTAPPGVELEARLGQSGSRRLLAPPS